MRRILVLLAVICAAAVATLTAFSHADDGSFPRPSPTPFRWELEFDARELRLYTDPATGEVYYYFTYLVTNRTGAERVWAPTLTLFTDAGEILAAGDKVPWNVQQRLVAIHKNELLEISTVDDIHEGPEHALEMLAVWPVGDRAVNRLSLFIGGISGETARVRNPLTGDMDVLRKTLQRDFIIRGDMLAFGSQPIDHPEPDRWIFR